MTVPVVLGVMVALQLDVVALRLARVHGVPVNDPVAVPPFVNATLPPGADAVPAEVSFMKAVQLTICPTATATAVDVATAVVARKTRVAGLPGWVPVQVV